LAEKIPAIYRNLQWRLLYRMSTHGISMMTFMENVSCEDVTLMIVEDSCGFKFGCFVFDDWKHRKKFYGSGESFVYTFRDGESVDAFYGTGNNSMY
jgi:exosome complex component MTR3